MLENVQISVNTIDRLDITDEYSVKCDFILNTVIFIDAELNISWRKFWKCFMLLFYWSRASVCDQMYDQPKATSI